MNFHSLDVFLGLCKNLHFKRTSEEFHMSASALSRLVKSLEEELGHKLFIRDKRHVELTEQGIIFLNFAKQIRGDMDKLKEDLTRSDVELTGSISIFATVTASQSILPEMLRQFREDYPGIHLELETGYAVNAIKRLREGVDVVVASLDKGSDDKYMRKIIRSIPVVAITSTTNSLDRKMDWSSVPLILPTEGPVKDNIQLWFREKGLKPLVYSEVPGNEAILSLAALGCGVGFVPKLVLQNSPLGAELEVLEGGPQLPEIDVGFCVQKKSLESSKIIQAFWHSI